MPLALADVCIETGRFHQIRVQFAFTRMMFEAGLLESSAKPRTIKPIHIDYRTEELLTANGLGEYLKAVKGV